MDSGAVARAKHFHRWCGCKSPAIVPLEINSTEITKMFTAGIYEKGNWKHPKCLPVEEVLGYPWKDVLL